MDIDIKKILKYGIPCSIIIAILIALIGMFGDIDSREYVVKQAALTGALSVHKDPGLYAKNFGGIYKYDRTGSFYFSKDKLDGDDGDEAQPLPGTMSGNSKALVSGVLKYRLPVSDSFAIALHRDYHSFDNVKMDLIRTQISTAIRQAAPLFTAEEAQIYRRPEFTRLVREILEQGEFQTYTETVMRHGVGFDTTAKEVTVTKLFVDSLGRRVITKPSTLKKYGIEIISLDIKGFDFDSTTTELLEANKKSMTTRIQGENAAITARQMALTAAARAEEAVAKAKGEEDVAKIRSVTQAQKAFEVAEYGAKTAKAQADSVRLAGEALAYANKLKVAAGLTPLERAEIDKDTKIGVAEALAKIQFPSTMIIGGGNGSSSPMEAVGLRALYDLADRASINTQSRSK